MRTCFATAAVSKGKMIQKAVSKNRVRRCGAEGAEEKNVIWVQFLDSTSAQCQRPGGSLSLDSTRAIVGVSTEFRGRSLDAAGARSSL